MRRKTEGNRARGLAILILAAAVCAAPRVRAADPGSDSSDAAVKRLLDLFVKKGYVNQEEASQVEAEAISAGTNRTEMTPEPASKWIIRKSIKNVELFGDIRLRYEDRSAEDPSGGQIDLQRFRYSVRVGLRGDAFDDVYYGLRLDTGANPRSAWLTMGSSASSSPPYQGPFGKSTANLSIGQVYLGWRPRDWADITLGKMPNPLFTTPMVWDPDINPEGAAERFKYTVGAADFFATFGQFIYQNPTPTSADSGLLSLGSFKQNAENVFQLAFEGGLNYHITTNSSAKIGANLYKYIGLKRTTGNELGVAPYFGDPYVGEGAYAGPGSAYSIYGYSGYGISSSLPGYQSFGYPNNQVGLNHLLVLEVPFEARFKIHNLDAKVFGDVAYNLEGSQRARDAAKGYANFLQNGQPSGNTATIGAFKPQTDESKAYQIGFELGNEGSLDLIGGSPRKHGWEFKTYWQHAEQYSLDPNIIDSDFFEGRLNLEGIYAAAAYGFTDNLIGTFRYGYAHRINDKLGTGGSNQDIPQMNPIEHFNLLQLDVSLKF